MNIFYDSSDPRVFRESAIPSRFSTKNWVIIVIGKGQFKQLFLRVREGTFRIGIDDINSGLSLAGISIETNTVSTRYWKSLSDGRVECRACPRYCRLRDGQRAACALFELTAAEKSY